MNWDRVLLLPSTHTTVFPEVLQEPLKMAGFELAFTSEAQVEVGNQHLFMNSFI